MGLDGGQFRRRQGLIQVVLRQLSRVYAVRSIGVDKLHDRSKQHHRFEQLCTSGLS